MRTVHQSLICQIDGTDQDRCSSELGVLMEISEEWETGKIYLQPDTKTPSI